MFALARSIRISSYIAHNKYRNCIYRIEAISKNLQKSYDEIRALILLYGKIITSIELKGVE